MASEDFHQYSLRDRLSIKSEINGGLLPFTKLREDIRAQQILDQEETQAVMAQIPGLEDIHDDNSFDRDAAAIVRSIEAAVDGVPEEAGAFARQSSLPPEGVAQILAVAHQSSALVQEHINRNPSAAQRELDRASMLAAAGADTEYYLGPVVESIDPSLVTMLAEGIPTLVQGIENIGDKKDPIIDLFPPNDPKIQAEQNVQYPVSAAPEFAPTGE